ncbi:FXSXX-COOH protein [Streptomyces sp. NPDC050504]|uniref:FXSXX-COOH protein n=1 Tax=Streptomyces sp. NPDC050504 TaxID=3365618 RepID=UPI00378BFDA0
MTTTAASAATPRQGRTPLAALDTTSPEAKRRLARVLPTDSVARTRASTFNSAL